MKRWKYMTKEVDYNSIMVRGFSVERVLRQYSDVNHPLTAESIQNRLEEFGLKDVVCRTINNDIERISSSYNLLKNKNCGLDNKYMRDYGDWQIVAIPKKGSFMQGQLFNDAELKLLYEMIQSFHFLTVSQKEGLIHKLYSNCLNVQIEKARAYKWDVHQSKPHRYIQGKYTMDNMEKVLSVIARGKRMKFDYAHYRMTQNGMISCYERKIVYPIDIFIHDGLVYMNAFPNEDKSKPRHYRLDKMSNILELNINYGFEDQDLRELSNKAHNHIDGFGNYEKEITLELLACEKVLDPLVERFNIYENLVISQSVGTGFDVKMIVEGVPSGDGLIKFLLGFKNQVRVVGPMSLVQQVEKIIKEMASLYLK